MPEILSPEEFKDLIRATAKLRQIGLEEAEKYLVAQGARSAGAGNAESTMPLSPPVPKL